MVNSKAGDVAVASHPPPQTPTTTQPPISTRDINTSRHSFKGGSSRRSKSMSSTADLMDHRPGSAPQATAPPHTHPPPPSPSSAGTATTAGWPDGHATVSFGLPYAFNTTDSGDRTFIFILSSVFIFVHFFSPQPSTSSMHARIYSLTYARTHTCTQIQMVLAVQRHLLLNISVWLRC